MIEFDQQIIEDYRQHYHKADLRYFALQNILAIFFTVVFSTTDMVVLKWSGDFLAIVGLRIFLFLLSVTAVAIFWRNRLKPRQIDIFLTVVTTAYLLCGNMIFAIREDAYLYDTGAAFLLMKFIFVLVGYSLVPVDNLWLRAMPLFICGTLIIAEGVLMAGVFTVGLLHILVLAVCLGAIMVIIVTKEVRQRRENFRQYLRQTVINEQLAHSIEIEKRLAEAERVNAEYAAELRVLSAQIKPHFLFNVLSSIDSLYRAAPDTAAAMLQNLAVYFKYAVNSDLEQARLSEELRVVKAFLDIQQIRMSGRMQYELRLNYQTDIEIPFCAIQTLVENAVIHGLNDCEAGGKIIISILEDEKTLSVSVSDNGDGIPADKITELTEAEFPKEKAGSKRSVGLWNVNRRLKLLGSAGLHIESVSGKYTTTGFDMPLINQVPA